MVYSLWLLGFALLFVALERIWPRTRQPVLRRGIWTDTAYLIFNSEYLGVLLGVASIYVIAVLDRALDLANLRQYVFLGLMSDRPVWLQLVLLFLVFDFAQWCIHNLLHRVPALWEFHKVHHSIEDMDWIGNWRFHWFEVVVYRVMLYPLAAWFGFAGISMFWYGVGNTFIGHFAHSNLRCHVGPLKYLINNPEMHVWHHAHPDSGPPDRNFAITLSVWDWLFRTAHLPRTDPRRLGFTGIETYPHELPGQLIAPFRRTQSDSEKRI